MVGKWLLEQKVTYPRQCKNILNEYNWGQGQWKLEETLICTRVLKEMQIFFQPNKMIQGRHIRSCLVEVLHFKQIDKVTRSVYICHIQFGG